MSGQYSLGEHYEAFIRAQVTSGRYAAESDVLREALRLLEAAETERQNAIREVRQSIERSRADGRTYSEDEVFDFLENRLQDWERGAV